MCVSCHGLFFLVRNMHKLQLLMHIFFCLCTYIACNRLHNGRQIFQQPVVKSASRNQQGISSAFFSEHFATNCCGIQIFKPKKILHPLGVQLNVIALWYFAKSSGLRLLLSLHCSVGVCSLPDLVAGESHSPIHVE